jgi:hypothetical protein
MVDHTFAFPVSRDPKRSVFSGPRLDREKALHFASRLTSTTEHDAFDLLSFI